MQSISRQRAWVLGLRQGLRDFMGRSADRGGSSKLATRADLWFRVVLATGLLPGREGTIEKGE